MPILFSLFSQPLRGRRLHSPLLLLLLCAPLLGGAQCEHVENPGTDDSYIRLPGAPTSSITLKDGPLLPLTPGARWVMATQTSEVRSEKPKPPEIGKETITVVGPRKVGEANGVSVEFRQGNGKVREEVYLSDDKGVSMIAAGFADKMTISPPMPLYHVPIKEGEVIYWTGLLRFKGTSAPGRAYSRVASRDHLKTPAGEFDVWRVDTVISTNVEGQAVALSATRWLAPGIGMVRQRWYAGNQVIMKDLLNYRVGGLSGGAKENGGAGEENATKK